MGASESAPKLVLCAMKHANCDCTGMKALINTLGGQVEEGVTSTNEAIDTFGRLLDYGCKGQVPNDSVIEGCGASETMCGHQKGSSFLLEQALGLRKSL